LIELPAPWRFMTMDWTASVPTTANASPFTGQVAQVIQWPGADNWKVTVNTPPLRSEDEARDWTSFVWDAQGGGAAFLLGDPLRRKPRGTVNTPIFVNGNNPAMAGVLNLKGFGVNQPRVLVRGDLIGVNSRLYQVRDPYVSADAGGHVTVTIGPTLRETLTDGMPVATRDAQGLFRLAKGAIQWSIDQDHMYTMSFPCVEAR
jgi:hypothetical protein